MDKKLLQDLYIQGEQADELLKTGHAREAHKILSDLSTSVEKTGDFDSYLAAKLTLSHLRCLVKLGDFKTAYSVWNANLEDSLHGIGIYSLESAQTTVEDMIAYDMICAFLHTLADADKSATASAVNQYLSRVCEQSLEEGNRATMKLAISNWKQHLRELFGASIPIEFAKPLIKFEKTLDETVKPGPLEFPMGSAWEKPRDFLEMSRFAEIKKVNRPTKKHIAS